MLRRFSCCAPAVWNSLLSFVHTADSFTSFRSQLNLHVHVHKTFVAGPLSAPLIPLPGHSHIITSLLTSSLLAQLRLTFVGRVTVSSRCCRSVRQRTTKMLKAWRLSTTASPMPTVPWGRPAWRFSCTITRQSMPSTIKDALHSTRFSWLYSRLIAVYVTVFQ